MTLQFESLTLKNFGPYREVEELDLQTKSDAPIVLIHGENTIGKTRLFRALRWCLYGSPEVNKTPAAAIRTLPQYMNSLASADGESEMSVRIRFSSGGRQYQLTRTANFGAGVPRVAADLRIDAQVVQQASIDAEIGRLLHPQISEFFLFDGELLGDFYDRLNESSERELLQRSIENVLGIPALQLAERDVSVLTEDVMQRQAKAIKSQRDSDNAKRRLRELKAQQESLDKDRKELQESITKTEDDLDDVRERIAAVEELKADAREMENLESLIKGDESEEKRLREDMKQVLAKGWLAPVSGKLGVALELVATRNDAASTRRADIRQARERVDLLERRMDGGACPTCLQELPPPDSDTQRAYADAKETLDRLSAEAGDEPDLPLERRISALIDKSTVGVYKDKQNQLDRVLRTQFERGRRLAAIKDRLKDNDAAEIRQLSAQQEKLEAALESYEEALRKLKPKQETISNEQNKLGGVLRRLGNAQPELQAEALFFGYVQLILDKTIERYRERTRAEVERAASAMFVRLIRDPEGYRGLRIGPNYHVELIGEHGDPMNTSEGGRQLVALSLIGALKHAAVRGGPVVLDSPLGRLDTLHRENVLQKWVPDLGSQAILLVQSGEISEAEAREVLGSKIGHEYRICRPHNDPKEARIERTQ